MLQHRSIQPVLRSKLDRQDVAPIREQHPIEQSLNRHADGQWSESNADIDGFVRFYLGGYNIAVTAISIRSRKKVGSVSSMGGTGSGRAPELAVRSLDSC